MFVLASKHNKLKDKYDYTLLAYYSLLDKYNNLVDKYNALVRKDKARDEAAEGDIQVSMSKAELRRLLQLVHPDRHNNSDFSLQMTMRLTPLLRKN